MLAVRVANSEELAQANDFATAPTCTLVRRALDHRCERRDIGLRLIRQRSTRRQMTFVASRSCIVGGEEPRRAVTIVEFADVRGAGQDVVVGIVGIGAETVTSAQFGPGLLA